MCVYKMEALAFNDADRKQKTGIEEMVLGEESNLMHADGALVPSLLAQWALIPGRARTELHLGARKLCIPPKGQQEHGLASRPNTALLLSKRAQDCSLAVSGAYPRANTRRIGEETHGKGSCVCPLSVEKGPGKR